MELWTMWLDSIQAVLGFLSSDVGLGSGLAIVVLTLMLRVVLLPVSWSCAYGACIRQKRLKKIQPELESLRERFQSDPKQLAEETMKLYGKKGLRFFEFRPVLGALVQMPVLLGMFSVLRQGLLRARFLWIESLSRPDLLISVIAAATTTLVMLANPDLPEQTRLLMILVPSIIAFIFAIKFASALGLYWVISNGFTAAQTSAVHFVVGRRIRAGKLAL